MLPVPPQYHGFLGGAIFSLSSVAALLFARFFHRTKDPLFLCFSIAFATLSLSNLLLLFLSDHYGDSPEDARHPLLYSLRLIAFAIILYAIIDKNRSRGKL